MMSRKDKEILAEVSKRVRGRFSEARIWAFGSRARGDASWESDFDTCIVLERVDDDVIDWLRSVAWEVGFEHECVITTVVLDSEQFEKGPLSESSLVGNILREGVAA